MKLAATVARIILGVIFLAAGVAGFFITPPSMPGLAGEFTAVLYSSHFMQFISAAQFVMGALLLVNRFVPVALIMLAAFIYNSFAFHATVVPAALFGPVIVTALWLLVALPYRTLFAPIFAAQPLTHDNVIAIERLSAP